MEHRLYRDEQHKKIGGVCAGLAEYFNMDVTLIRVLFFATLILKGGGLIIYIILWVCLPKKNYAFKRADGDFVDYKVQPIPFGNMPPQQPMDPFMAMPPKRASKGGLITGAVLVILGTLFLLNNFDFIPDWDFENLWPCVLVLIGGALIFSGAKTQPWDGNNWHNQHTTETTTDEKQEEQHNDNTPTV